MRILRSAVRWSAPPLLALGSFALGYAAFFPGLASSKLSDGSASSFNDTASRISKGNLLEKASPLERVAWLLEICSQPKSLHRDHALFEAIQQLQPGDFIAAVTDVPELSKWFSSMDGKLRPQVIEALIERWMDVDEDGLIRWLPLAKGIIESGTFKLPEMGGEDLGAIYGVVARRKPQWTFEQIQSLGPKMQPGGAVEALMHSAVEAGSPQAERWLTSFKGGPSYDAALTSYAETLARTDPERALNKVLAETPDNKRLLMQVLSIAAGRMPAAATALLSKLGEAERRQAMYTLAPIAGLNPDFDAFGWLDAEIAKDPELIAVKPNPDETNLGYLVFGIAQRDGPKTMEWIQNLPEATREAMSSTAIGVWANTNPSSLLDWLIDHPQFSVLSFDSLGSLATTDPDRFAKWMSSIPPGDTRQQAQYSAADQFLRSGKFGQAIDVFPKEGTIKPLVDASRMFGNRFAQLDVHQATRWLGTLQSTPLQQSAAEGVVAVWMLNSPAAAAAWAESLPAGKLRDSATGTIAKRVADRDFDAASEWLSGIEDERIRDQVITDLYKKRVSQKPSQAREWLRSLPGVNESVRNRLLARP